MLCNHLSETNEVMAIVERERRHFVRTCRDTTCKSIDALLIRRPDLRSAGALSIAAALVGHQLAVLKRQMTHSTWHSDLYKILFEERRCWPRDQQSHAPPEVAVITFNYDLNIEVAAAFHNQADNGRTAATSWGIARGLPIAHVHGVLSLDDEIVDLLNDEEAKPKLSIDRLRRIAKTLALSTDEAKELDSQTMEVARSWVRNSSEVLFLGFGFDPLNLKRIGVGSPDCWNGRVRRLLSTGHLSSEEMASAAAACGTIEFFSSDAPLGSLVRHFLQGTRWLGQLPVRVEPSQSDGPGA
jgi:hypothetical protein